GQGIEYTKVTGTSYATPFVTGSAALLMQWGIVLGNDRFMYGEKLKAYIRNGARPLGIVSEYPNSVTGYGVLCASGSLPIG
ncbi:MAG: S8 family serine peptidase, partial [Lachnospiraceae bacterium]|nr:S8 family serine peptidase [Lachnospiraceae bacterium]